MKDTTSRTIRALSAVKDFGSNYQVAYKILYFYIMSIMVIWIPVFGTMIYPNFYVEVMTSRSLDDPVNTRLYQDSDNLFNAWSYFSCFPGLMAAIPFLNADRLKRRQQDLESKDASYSSENRTDVTLKRSVLPK